LLNKLLAVKVLTMSQIKQLTAFQEEAKATSKLNHPSIISLLDFGLTESEVPYMVLEHIPGSSLEEFISREGPMEWRVARYVFAQICDALDYSHTHLILHRDMKPSNILLFQNQTGYLDVKIIDFGIAKIKSEGNNGDQSATMAGAPLYMSPDVGLGRDYDQRSEVYSLGCVLYEALTGKPPFEGHNAIQTLVMHAEDIPPLIGDRVDIEFPKALGPIVAKSLEKDPKDRFQSMSEFRNALLSIEPERVGEGTVTLMAVPAWRPSREQVAVAAAVLVGLGCVISYGAYLNFEKGLKKRLCNSKKWQSKKQ
jgi:Serine/threonine protein kinase